MTQRSMIEIKGGSFRPPTPWIARAAYFIVAVLGFSCWFFIAVPFASHRESYWWLGMVHSESFPSALAIISSTYRPLAQAATWLGFEILDPNIFPTSLLRQTLLQGFIYGVFVLSWWLIYSKAPQPRVLAAVAFCAGGVFFSGYIHLFHIYGLFYFAALLSLGAIFRFHASNTFEKREVPFAVVATVLAFWHPFATALFLGYYVGFYLETFKQRSKAQHLQAVVVFFAGLLTIAILVFFFPRDKAMPLDTRLFGFLVSYRANEINWVASLAAALLTQLVIFSMELPARVAWAASFLAVALSYGAFWKGLPVLLLWLCAALVKLARLRVWSLFFLSLAAALLPIGGGIGTPIYALFAIIVAIYVTALGWTKAENALALLKIRYVVGAIFASTMVVLMVRWGIRVPIVTAAARPLLTERERTYQLERILSWLHNSNYCSYDLAFTQAADSPIASVESAITRRNRPPAALEDVRLFWKKVLQCQQSRGSYKPGTAIVTFGGPVPPGARPVFELDGRYAEEAAVWVLSPQKIAGPVKFGQ